jgi:uncharacterized FlaG/YvyC family protein
MKLTHWLILAIVVLALGNVILWNMLSGSEMSREAARSIADEQKAEIKRWQNAHGRAVAEKNAAVADVKQLKESYPELAKVITDQMNVKLKNLETGLRASINASNSGSSVIRHDTIRINGAEISGIKDSVFVNDGYLSFKGEIEPDIFRWNYSYSDSVYFVLSTSRDKWYKPKVTTGTVMLSNPNAQVTGMTTIKVQGDRKKRFVLSVGPGYDPFRNQVSFSIHAGVKLIEF